MKKTIIIFFTLLIVMGTCLICYGQDEEIDVLINKQLKVTFNGDYQEFQNVNGVRVYPLSYEGTTYLPIRSISSLFESKIKWNGNTNSIILGEGELNITSSKKVTIPSQGENENTKVILNKNIKIYYNAIVQTFTDVNGKVIYPLSYNGTTYLPVRAVSNLLNLKIDWDGANDTVAIMKEEQVQNDNISKESNGMNTITINVNNKELIVELEDNQATKELMQKLNAGNIVVDASEYGGFEKVGSLGFSLTREDKQISTQAGDLVLYQGNQISLFYNSNSWSYTKLGKVTNMSVDELKDILGSEDVTLILKK